MAEPAGFKAATNEEFDQFVALCDSTAHWSSIVDNKSVKVWTQPSKESSINIVKVWAVFEDIAPEVLYDMLHDPDYRRVWDDRMIDGYNIEQIDDCNDVGYYSVKIGPMVSNRDFVNQRSWRVHPEGKEFLIMNHSVIHPNKPPQSGYVRAKSILTGYLIRPEGKGCALIYCTQSDPAGYIPAMITNQITKSFAPQVIQKIGDVTRKYPEWKSKNHTENKPWRKGSSFFAEKATV